MDVAVVLLTLTCYSLALFLWWRYQTPIYVFTLIGGHFAALGSPLWSFLYGIAYRSDFAVMLMIMDQPILRTLVIASAWFYPLPALLVFYLYQVRWWFPGYLTGLLTFMVFLLYYLVIETLGMRLNIWSYSDTTLPFRIPSAVLAATMAALTSLALLYVLLAIYRYSWTSMVLTLFPAVLLLSLLVHGLLGAPLWITLLLQAQNWALGIGMISTLGLLAWATHILTKGLQRVDQGVMV